MTTSKKIYIAIIIFTLLPIIVLYFSSLDGIALWLYSWLPAFIFAILGGKFDLFLRGLILIAWTILIVSIGYEHLVKINPEDKPAVDMLSAMLTMIAGGVGGNFMAHDIIQGSKSKPEKEQSKLRRDQ